MLKQFLLISVFLGVALAAPTNANNRIVNGTDVSIFDYPFMISFRGSSGGHSCGGSLIHPEYVLTAAHCVNPATPGAYSVQYGNTLISPTGNYIAYVEEITVHAGYNPSNSYINDIAIVKLTAPVTLQPGVGIVALEGGMVRAASPASLIGWGRLYSDGPIPANLQKVDYYIVSDTDCDRYHNGGIHPSHICAAIPEGGKGQCSGDSGGPLLVNGKQVGIVSWSVKPCAIAPYPGVLTEVAYYIDWINHIIGRAVEPMDYV